MLQTNAKKKSVAPKSSYPQAYLLINISSHDDKATASTNDSIKVVLSKALMSIKPQEPYPSREEPQETLQMVKSKEQIPLHTPFLHHHSRSKTLAPNPKIPKYLLRTKWFPKRHQRLQWWWTSRSSSRWRNDSIIMPPKHPLPWRNMEHAWLNVVLLLPSESSFWLLRVSICYLA